MDSLKDLKTSILMVHLLDSNWDEKIGPESLTIVGTALTMWK